MLVAILLRFWNPKCLWNAAKPLFSADPCTANNLGEMMEKASALEPDSRQPRIQVTVLLL